MRVTGGELDVEVGDKGVHVVVALGNEVKGRGEGELARVHAAYVDLAQQARVRHALGRIDDVDERLAERRAADAAHVRAVDVRPPLDLVVLVLAVLDERYVERGAVGKHEAVGAQPLVARAQHRLQHALVEQAEAHPLRDDDVHALDAVRQLGHLLHFAAHQCHH